MQDFDLINDEIKKLHSYDSLVGKELALAKYPTIESLTCGGNVPILELFEESELSCVYMRFKPYLDDPEISSESQVVPVIESLGNVYICLGTGPKNKGFVYYLDFDFGCFLLDESLDSFLSKLVEGFEVQRNKNVR